MSDVTAKDWEKPLSDKWEVLYIHSQECVDYAPMNGLQYEGVYFSTKEKAQEAVEAIGEDNFKKYILEMAD